MLISNSVVMNCRPPRHVGDQFEPGSLHLHSLFESADVILAAQHAGGWQDPRLPVQLRLT
eukprot:m.630553 g.630553  ORF g.630553 m.630553 type:complete len:60 (-) comp22567_c1_seq14:519-698(-)